MWCNVQVMYNCKSTFHEGGTIFGLAVIELTDALSHVRLKYGCEAELGPLHYLVGSQSVTCSNCVVLCAYRVC